MKKLIALTCLITIILTGCKALSDNKSNIHPTTFLEPAEIENNSQIAPQQTENFNFLLPDGFSIDNITDKDCSIIYNNNIVGGVILTSLGVDVISNPTSDIIMAYLESFVTPPLVYEYMMGYSENNPTMLEISLNIVDLKTSASHEYKHYLFERENICYDMWLDAEKVDGETMCHILISTGIDKFAEFDE